MGTLEEKERDRWGLRSGAELGRRLLLPSFRPSSSAVQRRRDAPTNIFVRSIRKYFAKVQSNKVIGERGRGRGRQTFRSSIGGLSWFGLREKMGDTADIHDPLRRMSSSFSSSSDDNITVSAVVATEAKEEKDRGQGGQSNSSSSNWGESRMLFCLAGQGRMMGGHIT